LPFARVGGFRLVLISVLASDCFDQDGFALLAAVWGADLGQVADCFDQDGFALLAAVWDADLGQAADCFAQNGFALSAAVWDDYSALVVDCSTSPHQLLAAANYYPAGQRIRSTYSSQHLSYLAPVL
jgi:hypothetical protein